MSELHIPPEVADAMRALRPELRRKLSLRDIDDMTRPFRERIAELERAINSLCLPPGIDGSAQDRANFTISCLREAVSERERYRSAFFRIGAEIAKAGCCDHGKHEPQECNCTRERLIAAFLREKAGAVTTEDGR